jgi:hypothetical protein
MGLLREMTPRKAKYGFTSSIGTSNFVDLGAFISDILGKPTRYLPIPVGEKDTRAWWVDLIVSNGNAKISVYINDEDLYNKFLNANNAYTF